VLLGVYGCWQSRSSSGSECAEKSKRGTGRPQASSTSLYQGNLNWEITNGLVKPQHFVSGSAQPNPPSPPRRLESYIASRRARAPSLRGPIYPPDPCVTLCLSRGGGYTGKAAPIMMSIFHCSELAPSVLPFWTSQTRERIATGKQPVP
jgi:hypothetical protein